MLCAAFAQEPFTLGELPVFARFLKKKLINTFDLVVRGLPNTGFFTATPREFKVEADFMFYIITPLSPDPGTVKYQSVCSRQVHVCAGVHPN